MRGSKPILMAILTVFAFSARASEFPYPTYLFLGSGGLPHTSGMTSPAAATPFGLVRLGPDTRIRVPLRWVGFGGQSTAGYGHNDRQIFGFSHNRLIGTGVRDGGAFRVLPVERFLPFKKSPPSIPFHPRHSVATPGYYGVKLASENIHAELTATPRCGVHRYTQIRNSHRAPLRVLLEASSALDPQELPSPVSLKNTDANPEVFELFARARGDFANRQDGLPTYGYGEWSVRPSVVRVKQTSKHLWAEIEFAPEVQAVGFKLCLSHVSAENAKINFESEVRALTFEQARSQAHNLWTEQFSRAQIQFSDPKLQTLFYSSFYFASLMPTLFTDVNGEYLGFDKKIGRAEAFTYRTDLSLWDTFRTAHPWYQWVNPEIQRDTVHSLMAMAKVNGVFPRWAFGAADSGSMFGSPALMVIAEAYLKGIRDFNVPDALAAMWTGATAHPYTREAACVQYGYCPSDLVKKSVSKTLENAWAFWAAQNLAEASGNREYQTRFAPLARTFEGLYDPATRFFRPKKSNGTWDRMNPKWTSYFEFLYKPAKHYAEGGPHHYRYTAVQDPQWLIQARGGPEVFVRDLEDFMKGTTKKRAALNPGAKYWHGNEHNLHALYLFNEAGRPDRTQYWARWALRTRYAVAPNGLDGNDDGGTLTSWYLLSSLGFYPINGSDRYWLGSPQVNQARLNLGGGHALILQATNQGPKQIYVKQVKRNGVRWCSPHVRHQDLIDATWEFEMSATPQATYDCVL